MNADLVQEVETLKARCRSLEHEAAMWQLVEAQLIRSELKYRTLLDEVSDPIFSFTQGGVYEYVNPAFAEGVGKPRDQIIGKTIWDVFARDEADRRYAVVEWVFKHRELRELEVRVPQPEGYRYYLTTVKPIFNDRMQVSSVICISKEITSRMFAELCRLKETG